MMIMINQIRAKHPLLPHQCYYAFQRGRLVRYASTLSVSLPNARMPSLSFSVAHASSFSIHRNAAASSSGSLSPPAPAACAG